MLLVTYRRVTLGRGIVIIASMKAYGQTYRAYGAYGAKGAKGAKVSDELLDRSVVWSY